MLDVDADKGGLVAWDLWQDQHERIERPTVTTGGGGLHLFFRHSELVGNRVNFRRGLDFRGDGGYVVAAPSTHTSGRRYEWRIQIDATEEHGELPDWMRSVIEKKPEDEPPEATAVEASPASWDLATPESVKAALELATPRFRKMFERDKRLKLKGEDGTPSGIDWAVACGLYELGVHDPKELAEGIMASRYKDGDAWASVRGKMDNYFGHTAARAIAHVGKQQAEETEMRESLPAAWSQHFMWNELGDAKRFLAIHEADLAYHPIDKRFLVWDGALYAGDDLRRGGSMGVEARLVDFLEQMPRVLPRMQKTAEARDKALAHARRAGTSGRMGGIMRIVRSQVSVVESQLDSEPYLVNCGNGFVDLETGKLHQHERSHLMTKIAGAPYIEGVRCRPWEAFLERCLPDPEVREFFALVVGYSLLGIQPEQRFAFVWGPGSTGKSTAIKTVQAAFGSYHRSADFNTFLVQPGRSSSGPTSDLARLARTRMVSAIEVGHGASLNTGLVKQLSGGDMVTARKLWGDEQEWEPSMMLWFCANDRPKGRVDDDALWRRLIPFEFDQVVAGGEVDSRLTERLTAPMSRVGVLGWAIAAARRYLDVGRLDLPPACVAGVESYKRHSNPMQAWIEDSLRDDALGRVPKAEAWSSYVAWCKDNGERPQRKAVFRKVLDAEHETVRVHGRDCWRGLALHDA